MLIWLIIYNNCWVMCAWEWLCCHESSFKLTVLEKQSNSYIVKIVSIFLTLLTLNFDLYLAHWKPSLFVEVNLCSSSFFCWNYSESSVQITRTIGCQCLDHKQTLICPHLMLILDYACVCIWIIKYYWWYILVYAKISVSIFCRFFFYDVLFMRFI